MKANKLILLRRSPSSVKVYIYRDNKVRGSVVSAQLYRLNHHSSKLGADVIVHFNEKNIKSHFKNSILIEDFTRQYFNFIIDARTVRLFLSYRKKETLETRKLH